MKLKLFIFFFVVPLSACSSQSSILGTCSGVKAITVPNDPLQGQILAGSLPSAWGGVIDLLENASSPDTSKRERCTVTMDFVPVPAGQTANIAKLAFWTADHCLKFARAESAELNLFDPERKVYVRFPVSFPALEKYKQGLTLFRERVRTNPGAEADADLAAFQRAGEREPVLLDSNAQPPVYIIERGDKACQADTAAYKSANPGMTAVCSTVLDLARLDAVVEPTTLSRPEIKNALERMSAYLQLAETKRFEDGKAAVPAIPLPDYPNRTLQSDFLFFLKTWREKVVDMTRWRGFEAQSALIERVRTCTDGNTSGICAQVFRDYFKSALDEYRTWNVGTKTFPLALHDEVYAPQTDTKHNLVWLLGAQTDIKKFSSYMIAQSSFASNLLRKGSNSELSLPLPTLGESGALYFGLTTSLQMVRAAASVDPVSLLQFTSKSVLVPYSTSSNAGLSYLLQPGDSGSVWLVANTPIGVVATVDGAKTSGGASVRPLPEYTEEESSSDGAQPSNGKKNRPLNNCK